MKGAHDAGGQQGFGPVAAEANEPVFHEPWEARTFAIVSTVGELGRWTIDEDRHTCENRPREEYLALSYYAIWYDAVSKLVVAKGLVSAGELQGGKISSGMPTEGALHADRVWSAITAPGSYRREAPAKQRFRTGDRVRAKIPATDGHTRLPAYLGGHIGEVVAVHGAHVFPDSNAHGKGEDPQWLYTVRFTARELWNSDTRDTMHAEMWEPYLESA